MNARPIITYRKVLRPRWPYVLLCDYRHWLGFELPSRVQLGSFVDGNAYTKQLTIHTGYAWDGPSGPAIDTRDFMRASLVHDALYQAIREGQLPPSYRRRADQEMRRIAREDGMPWWRRLYTYAAVRLFGGKHAARQT